MRIPLALAALFALTPGLGSAQNLGTMPDASGHKSVAYTATLTLNTSPSSTNQPCNIGYSATCGSGVCTCTTFTGSGAGSAFGTSSDVTLALTADKGAKTIANSCFPVFGNLSIVGSKDTETIDVSATICQTLDGGLQLSGGFQFREPSTRNLEAVGTVSIAAKDADATKFRMKLQGRAVAAAPQG